MQVSKISIETKDGTYIPANIYNTGEKSIKGIVIVCHGFGEHSGSYKELAEFLVLDNYTCIVFDQRGHGNLPKAKLGVIPSYQSFLDDVGAVTAQMKQKAPNTPVVLYGNSMGGNIAVNYLLRHGQSDFACAVLESPWLGIYKEVGPFKVGMAKALSYVFPGVPLPEKDTKLPLADITGDEQKQKKFENDPLYHNRMSLRMFTQINDGCIYAVNSASSLSIPTFLAIAKDESIVSNKVIQMFQNACGSNVTSKEYLSHHSIHNDVKREDFYQDLIDFLDTHCYAVQPV